MAEKYTLHEVRQLKTGLHPSRTSAEGRKKMFWEDLDDIELSVSKFVDLMRDRMFDKAAEGYIGWDEKDCQQYIKEQLQDHVDKGDFVDIANIAMMLYFLTLPESEDKQDVNQQ